MEKVFVFAPGSKPEDAPIAHATVLEFIDRDGCLYFRLDNGWTVLADLCAPDVSDLPDGEDDEGAEFTFTCPIPRGMN